MRELRIYLDTSVINFLLADDAPEKRAITQAFFERLKRSDDYKAFASTVVQREIERTRDDDKRVKLRRFLTEYPIQIIDAAMLEPEVSELAAAYLAEGVLPQGSIDDALHVGIATILELDVLASWNYRHLANYRRELRFAGVNAHHGFTRTPRLLTPMELSDEDIRSS